MRKSINWTQEDASSLREYISKHPKFLEMLNSRRPDLGGATIETRALQSAVVEGFELALQEFDSMTIINPSPETTPFVDTTIE